ncbi:peroxiredoxin [Candidatus Synechococcus calcipolaris G9]|uniref:thioredoxin-dependent peroxiredoxin n=1 Tax=Candidatus Synechococcus calcipolaris G9 TaxID=1497997 RepID=A0ABT6F0R6_9SYNE|nr:peroxiredoxin [Candidatus Synechococcus calcipolaris]MDG2991415.1 peroxiredoxin [Candidatus Synechococcus calcipolaris G9]
MIPLKGFYRLSLACLLALIIYFGWSAPAHALGGELPPLDTPAPEFNLPTHRGDGSVSLADYRGKWLVVYFYPKDFTSGCTLEAQRFQRDLDQFHQRNTEVIGISADSIDSHAEFCDSEGLTFPLLSDTTGEVSKAYGSWLGFISLRHSFIIDPDGILRDRYVKVSPAIHSQEVLTRLDELQRAG